MAETPDPVAALSAKDIPSRAAGARDLSAAGEPAHIARLLELAIRDPSPGVRLACAAGAADILSRWRLPPRFDAIPAADREAWYRVVTGVDPGLNAGLFQVCAAIGVPAALTRITGGLRDPRADVRTGAWGGLLRLCASAAVNGNREVEQAVVALFGDARIPSAVRGEIARVCAHVGYTAAIPAIRLLAETAERLVQTTAADALQRLEWPVKLQGIWTDYGLDAGQVEAAAEPVAFAALQDASAVVIADADGVRRTNLRGAAHADRGGTAPPLRQLTLRRPGTNDLVAALQIGTRTLFEASGDEITAFGDRVVAASAWGVLAFIDPLLPPTAASARLRGIARLRASDAPGALEILEVAIEMKKVPADTWWWLADALHALGRDAEARPHLERFLSKVAKKAPHAAEARKRLGAAG